MQVSFKKKLSKTLQDTTAVEKQQNIDVNRWQNRMIKIGLMAPAGLKIYNGESNTINIHYLHAFLHADVFSR